ncbi:uncharacterized protein BBA_06063 [Beauveria bassiana ARSEF 2860]|uniref:Uncharacterized protein n=1 Tax=Beauveria bassiana (strain ARSEF 2860) TaxID=655819 RepID=J5JGR4_BEAB2|nr:uncharacterized protein BBA_06063 [Beauveria bassiana ARSEF 2860]EJP64888.1 hypothetical protein BBA_06063 [Beauveria bassiana ARSEF 2860]
METCPLAPAISLLLAARRVPIYLVDVAAPKRYGIQDGALCETICSLIVVSRNISPVARSAFALV